MKKHVALLISLSAALVFVFAGCSKKPVKSIEERPAQQTPGQISEEPKRSESSYPESAWAKSGEPESEFEPEPESSSEPEPPISNPISEPPPREATSPAAAPEAPKTLEAVKPEAVLDGEKIELELLRLINGLRAEAGVEALGIQEDMRFAARIRSAEALESFSHTRPDGTPYNTAFGEAGFDYAGKWHGENLSSLRFAEGMFDESAAALEMFTGLKSSPGHYQNMVGKNFVQAGIGVSAELADGVVSIASAQMFSSL